MLRFLLALETLFCVLLFAGGIFLFRIINNATDDKNIQNFIKLTQSYQHTVDAVKVNIKQSSELVPHIKSSVDDMKASLESISRVHIRIPGISYRPFRDNKSIKRGIASLSHTSSILESYNKTTSQTLITSLELTSSNLEKISSSLEHNKTQSIVYIMSLIAGIIIFCILNMILMIMFFIKIQMLEKQNSKATAKC